MVSPRPKRKLGLILIQRRAMQVREDLRGDLRVLDAGDDLQLATIAAWIFMWHYELIAASLACMLVILGSLLVAYVRLNAEPPVSFAERACVDLPFSLYLGWITTATLANLAALFFDLDVYPFELAMDEWAILTVVAATGIYAAAGVRTGDAVYTAVFAWAALGIVLQTLEISQPVRLAAAAGCAVAVVVTAVSLVGGRRHGRI
jgi:hypothetical protein